MDRFFSIFGKTVLVFMLVSLLIGAGIFLGERFGKKSSDVTPTPISPQTALPTQSPSPTVVPTQSHTIIEAGGIAPFVAYTLSANPSWTAKKEHTDTMDKLTLTQGDYHLVILQAAIGGGGCTFPGDTPAAMSVDLTNPIDIPLTTGAPLRRGTAVSPTTGKTGFTICQKNTDGHYGTFTLFGAINYITPLSPDSSIMMQLDSMVGSLQKQ